MKKYKKSIDKARIACYNIDTKENRKENKK